MIILENEAELTCIHLTLLLKCSVSDIKIEISGTCVCTLSSGPTGGLVVVASCTQSKERESSTCRSKFVPNAQLVSFDRVCMP